MVTIAAVNRLASVPIDLAALPGFQLPLIPGRVKCSCEWRGGERCGQGHDNEYRESPCAENLGLQSDVEYNQLDQTFARHESADRERLSPYHASSSGSQRSANEFGRKCNDGDTNGVTPSDTVVQQANIGVQSRKSKV